MTVEVWYRINSSQQQSAEEKTKKSVHSHTRRMLCKNKLDRMRMNWPVYWRKLYVSTTAYRVAIVHIYHTKLAHSLYAREMSKKEEEKKPARKTRHKIFTERKSEWIYRWCFFWLLVLSSLYVYYTLMLLMPPLAIRLSPNLENIFILHREEVAAQKNEAKKAAARTNFIAHRKN